MKFSLLLSLFAVAIAAPAVGAERARPNIVWIMGEDIGPELGCYGDRNAITPNMDRLAGEGTRYRLAFTHAPVCAPSRSGLITGRYPTSLGSHHMRSMLRASPEMFTTRLREAGYFVAWPGKTDFNFAVPKGSFDSTADWVKALPRQPFFAYVNLGVSHESQIRAPEKQRLQNVARLKPGELHAPEKLEVPPYYPDAPEVRRDLANYYDLVTAVDYQVGDILAALEAAGLKENTVVILTGDHGRGLPRSKRWVYDSGTHVPLIVRWPGVVEPGTVSDELVSFIDFAPTTLAMAGVSVPKSMQGQVFAGPRKAKPRKYVYAARDRMDETFDRIRSVRDHRFQYIRNFQSELPYAQPIQYMELMPTMRVWREWNAAGKLKGPQALFFAATKPEEELYDTEADPHEVRNLAGDPGHRKKLLELRAALDAWIKETRDLGAVPETELIRQGLVVDKLSEYEKRKAK